MNKKGQGLPLNVVIVGIIVIVVLIILLVFFVGGTSQVTQKIREVFGLQASGQQTELAIQACQQSCDSVRERTGAVQKNSLYCKAALIVDLDANTGTPPEKVACGPSSSKSQLTIEPDSSEDRQGITTSGGDLGVPCPGIDCSA